MGSNIFLRLHNHFGKYEFSSLQYEYSAFITFHCFHLFTRRELEKTLVKTLDCTNYLLSFDDFFFVEVGVFCLPSLLLFCASEPLLAKKLRAGDSSPCNLATRAPSLGLP